MGKLILLIEGNEEEQRVLSRYLEFVGARVQVAGNGDEGLVEATRETPDLILLDMHLPGQDGWAAFQRLRKHPATSSIPVLAVTDGDIDRRRLDTEGFCGCLRKPLTPYQVLEEVERCLGRVTHNVEPQDDGRFDRSERGFRQALDLLN